MVTEAGLNSTESAQWDDPGIVILPALLDVATIGAHLKEIVPHRYGSIKDIRFQILKHHQGSRCTFEISFLTEAGREALIGKVYAQNRSDVYDAMVAISKAGFRMQDPFSIPKPLAYIPALRLLVQEKVDGRRAKQIFLLGSERERTEAAERCADWLAEFHSLDLRFEQVFQAADRLESISRWSQRIASLGQPFPPLVERLAGLLEDRVPALKATRLCPGHGSYNCNQIILADRRVVVFDWDTCCLADPCRDITRFLVALRRLGLKYLGSIRALDGAAEVFKRTYSAYPSVTAANLPWYTALTCLTLAKYEVSRVSTFRHGIEALIREGLRALEE